MDPAEVVDVGEAGAAPVERSLGRADEVREADTVEPLLHRRRVGDVEEAVAAVRADAAAGRHLHLQRERAVGDPVAAEQRVAAPVLDEQTRHGAVAEVEHEARALVRVVEEVRLAAGGDDEHGTQLVLREEHVAGNPQRDRRPAGDVVVLDGVRVVAPEPVRDPRRRLPDGVVLPRRPEVHDHIDLAWDCPRLVEKGLGSAD